MIDMVAACLLRNCLFRQRLFNFTRLFWSYGAGINGYQSTLSSNASKMDNKSGGVESGRNGNEKKKSIKLEHNEILEGIPEHLSQQEVDIILAHNKAVKANEDIYVDPETGYNVLTRKVLLSNNECCGNACRHCPYGHVNVPNHLKTKSYNSLFYV